MTGADLPVGASRLPAVPASSGVAPVASNPTERLLGAVEELRERVSTLRLPLQVPEVERARQDRARLTEQLDDYLLPRLRQVDAPLLAVVGGSTGAGKSTLVNSLLGERVTRSGVLRPTTRSPILVHHPDDASWFRGDRILPSLARLTGSDAEPSPAETEHRITTVRLAATTAVPPGMALLDAPDIDSVVNANRALAAQLLAAGDLWIFVTTAARYADAVPWDLLRTAAERGTAVAVVLDRVSSEAADEIAPDLRAMLERQGLEQAPLFVVPETSPDEEGLLPTSAVAGLRDWLNDLASSAQARQAVIRRTLDGALTSLEGRVPALAAAAREQYGAETYLREQVSAAFAHADTELDAALTDGSLLRGEVLARWHEFVGTGEVFRTLEQGVSRLRDRVTAFLTGRPAPAGELGEAVQTGVAALLTASVEEALEKSVNAWRETPAGRDLLAQHAQGDLTRPEPGFDERVDRLVRDWQAHVLELVRSEAGDRRSKARFLSFGVNGLAVVLMIVVFASTAFIPTGAEVGVGAGTALVGQRLLEAVFGDQAVRALAKAAHADLQERVAALMASERARLSALVDDAQVDPAVPDRLREAAQDVAVARRGLDGGPA